MVFRRVISEHMGPPPVTIPDRVSAVQAVGKLAEAHASAAIVVDEAGRLAGIVTEQDVVRRLLGGDQPVEAIMTAPVLTVRADDQLYRAIGLMRRHRLRHMPVVDAEGVVVGMLELQQALAAAAGPLVDDIDRLTHEDSFAGLAQVKAAQAQLAERLLADSVPAPEIQALLADCWNVG